MTTTLSCLILSLASWLPPTPTCLPPLPRCPSPTELFGRDVKEEAVLGCGFLARRDSEDKVPVSACVLRLNSKGFCLYEMRRAVFFSNRNARTLSPPVLSWPGLDLSPLFVAKGLVTHAPGVVPPFNVQRACQPRQIRRRLRKRDPHQNDTGAPLLSTLGYFLEKATTNNTDRILTLLNGSSTGADGSTRKV